MSKTKISTVSTCAGSINVVTVKEFVQLLLSKNEEVISDAVADVEILGLENDGKPPIIKKVYADYDNQFISTNFSLPETTTEWKTEIIKLPVLDTDPVESISKQLEKIICFESSSEHGRSNLIDMIEYLSIKSLEHFNNPDHFIDFGDNKFAIVTLNDLKIETCVYNKQVRAGIIYERKSFFGLKVVK